MAKKKRTDTNLSDFEDAFDEIAGYPSIDESLLKRIEAGEVELTDDLVVELVKQSPACLDTPPFQQKLSQWTRKGDKKKLNRIHTKTHSERRGRHALKQTGGFKNIKIADAYWENVNLIADFKKEHQDKSNRVLMKLFQDRYPGAKIDFTKHRSPKELAYVLTCKQQGICDSILRKIVKYTHKATDIIK